MKTRNISGETGQVAFDDNGDRIYAEYDVINIREKQQKKVVGSLYFDSVSFIINYNHLQWIEVILLIVMSHFMLIYF